jgi:formylglycine-generating enzyme required for sulfatase activity
VHRGSCWLSRAYQCRSAFRDHHPPDYRSSGLGFRLTAVLLEK